MRIVDGRSPSPERPFFGAWKVKGQSAPPKLKEAFSTPMRKLKAAALCKNTAFH